MNYSDSRISPKSDEDNPNIIEGASSWFVQAPPKSHFNLDGEPLVGKIILKYFRRRWLPITTSVHCVNQTDSLLNQENP